MKDINGKRLKKLVSQYSDTWNIGSVYLGNYIFNIKSSIDDLWNIYFMLRLILEINKYYNWIEFYNRYMQVGDI